MKILIITNNSEIVKRYENQYRILYRECSYREILLIVRDHIHLGHKLLTHPLSGSVKPNETPFKTILLKDEAGILDMDSLKIIEKSIEAANKFFYSEKPIDPEILDDFRCIDLSLIENVISKLA